MERYSPALFLMKLELPHAIKGAVMHIDRGHGNQPACSRDNKLLQSPLNSIPNFVRLPALGAGAALERSVVASAVSDHRGGMHRKGGCNYLPNFSGSQNSLPMPIQKLCVSVLWKDMVCGH